MTLNPNPSLMSSALFLIAPQNFRDEELLQPKQVLEEAGITCKIASLTTDLAIGKLGAEISPDLATKDVNADDFDAIILVGGPGAPELADFPEVIDLINLFYFKEKLIAAICIAPILLAKAGILTNKKATVFVTPESVKTLEEAGALVVLDEVVVDGRLITANGPGAAFDFGQKIKEYLIR